MKPTHQLDIYTVGDGAVDRSRLDHVTDIFRPTTLALLDRVGVRRGMACLDVGCGTAGVTFDLARLVGPEGSVVGLKPGGTLVAECTDYTSGRGCQSCSWTQVSPACK